MSRNDSLYIEDMSHEAKFRGDDIGRPAVKVTFGTDEDEREVAGLINTFEAYNWRQRVSDGHSFLILRGNRPLSKKNREGLESLLYSLKPRYCEAQVSGYYEPPREIKSYIDSYLVDLKVLEGDREDTIDFYTEQSRNFDACDFMFRFENPSRTEDKVYEWKSGKRVYPHNIHLYIDENEDDWLYEYKRAEKLAGQHGWNVVPPVEIAMAEKEEDDENEES